MPTSACPTDDLLEMYRLVALARAVDERMWILNRAGRIPFVISGQGHEGAQVGIAWALEKGKDWIAPFYRSIATCLTFGMSPRDIMTAQYATAIDPSSGGRQMPGHYGYATSTTSCRSRRRSRPSSSTRSGIALAAKIRKTGQVALTIDGRGQLATRATSTRGSTSPRSTSCRSSSSSRTTATRSSVPLARQVAGVERRRPGGRLRHPGRDVDGSDVLACYAAAREAVDRARARRRARP